LAYTEFVSSGVVLALGQSRIDAAAVRIAQWSIAPGAALWSATQLVYTWNGTLNVARQKFGFLFTDSMNVTVALTMKPWVWTLGSTAAASIAEARAQVLRKNILEKVGMRGARG
jgi:hypothetical protein